MKEKNVLLRKEGITPMFPSNPVRVDISIAGGYHWLCRFTATLPIGPLSDITVPSSSNSSQRSSSTVQRQAIVLGSIIDIRIGAGNEVIGLVSYWRPCNENPIIASRYPPPMLTESHDHVEIDDAEALNGSSETISRKSVNESNKNEIYYVINGNQEPQKYLSPFYLRYDESGSVDLFPASTYSLAFDINEEATENGLRLSARIKGREDFANHQDMSKSFRYKWISWSITDKEEGAKEENFYKEHGTGSYMTLTSDGLYNVTLLVEDRITRNIGIFQKLVYLNNKLEI